jgi:hypothetical protein
MAKYICTNTFVYFFESKPSFTFYKDSEYEFAKKNDVFYYFGDAQIEFIKSIFNDHFMLASKLENKGETEDSRNTIKDTIDLGNEASKNIFDAFKKAQEIKDDFQNTNFLIENIVGNKLNFQSDLELDFDMEVQSTLQKIQQLLLVKGKEYRRENNPYHNFEIGSQISGEIPEKVLQGFLLKHLVSYQDMLNDIEQGKLPKIELVEEKMNDILTYYIIQKAQILNRIKKS